MQQRLVLGMHSKGRAPATSYWVGVSREELKAAIARRRAQQMHATTRDLTYDPTIAATAALAQDHPWKKASR